MDSPVDSNGIELVSLAAIEDEAEKRAHHNALERKRRDHIKDSFYCLRDAVPQLRGEKVGASRALILNKATDYIRSLKGKNMCHKKEIDDIKKQNDVLEQEIDKIIKLNNSLGKDRIELVGNDFVKVAENGGSPEPPLIPHSTPPTFTRITEKSRGPAIGKAETAADEEEASTDTPDSLPAVVKINKPLDPSDTVETKRLSAKVNGGKPATITLSQSAVTRNGGTIQIPASALAKALPNGFKGVTAIYRQTGNNKPIRLQIIPQPNGAPSTAQRVTTVPSTSSVGPYKSVKKSGPKEEDDVHALQKEMKKVGVEKEEQESRKSDGIRTLQNQPIYARHRPLHSSPVKERRILKDKSGESAKDSEYDSFKTERGLPEAKVEGRNEAKGTTRVPRIHPKFQSLPRDPSAIATISESELAFLTRPSNANNKPAGGKAETEQSATKDGSERHPGPVGSNNPNKDKSAAIEHSNIPILYKGSLVSDRDKEVDAEREPVRRQMLFSARAMDGSRPFSCHICGKSFNMLSSLKVHEHIHVPVKKKPFPCDLCHRSFMTLRILSQHKESHYGRISSFHRQSSLGKKSTVSFATHPSSHNGSSMKSPRTSITNIFHVRASSPNDAPGEKKGYGSVSVTPKLAGPSKPIVKSANQRVLPTTRVRQGQVIVQARPGAGQPVYKIRTKAEAEEARNFGLKAIPLKRSPFWNDPNGKKIGKIKPENPADVEKQ